MAACYELDKGTGRQDSQHAPTFRKRPVSYMINSWFGALLWKGYRTTLNFDDLFLLPVELHSANVYPAFSAAWLRRVDELKKNVIKGEIALTKARNGESCELLLRTLWDVHKWQTIILFALQCFTTALQFVGPLMLNKIVTILTLPPTNQAAQLHLGYVYASVSLGAPLLNVLMTGISNRLSANRMVALRAELLAHIYRKAFKLSEGSKLMASTGKIVNLMSTDAAQLQQLNYSSFLITGILTIIIGVVLLWFQIRWATFIGLGVILLTSSVTKLFMKKIQMLQKEALKHTDRRVQIMNRLLTGIRTLKMYAWEAIQESMIMKARENELCMKKRRIPIQALFNTILSAAPTIGMAACFAAYGSVKPEQFTAARIFTAISLFNLMRPPLMLIPYVLIQLAYAVASAKRLVQYFLLDERTDYVERCPGYGIQVQGGEFLWQKTPSVVNNGDAVIHLTAQINSGRRSSHSVQEQCVEEVPTSAEPCKQAPQATGPMSNGFNGYIKQTMLSTSWPLHDINLEVKFGELVCVVGRTGSGKTSLAQAIIGSMHCASGTVKIGDRVAYVPQQAWIINATVRDNVTLGLPFDQERWDLCIKACCLAADLEILPGGADAEIGEKGFNLSGGQRQRISLARAVYQDADVYILDDPVSAVDVHVGQIIFEDVITGLLKGKARLLVTNNKNHLPQANHIVVMENGHVLHQGDFNQCSSRSSFQSLLFDDVKENPGKQYLEKTMFLSSSSAQPDTKQLQEDPIAGISSMSSITSGFNNEVGGVSSGFHNEVPSPRKHQKLDRAKTVGSILTTQEERQIGKVNWNVYRRYIVASGIFFFTGTVCLVASENVLRLLSSWWLSRWTQAEARIINGGDRLHYLIGYIAFSLAVMVAIGLHTCNNMSAGVRASHCIHLKCLTMLLGAPLSFFDSTPTGRILNRFSKDLQDIDNILPPNLTIFLRFLLMMLTSAIFISVVQPWILCGMVPLSVLYYLIQSFYRTSYIELMRLDAMRRSPVFSHFSESLCGIDSIRMYGLETIFATRSDAVVDLSTRTQFNLFIAGAWFAQRLDCLGAVIVFLVGIIALVNRHSIAPSIAAMALSEALSLTSSLKQVVNASATLEAQMNCVERLSAYSDLPQESITHDSDTKLDQHWPQTGHVVIKDLWMRYRPDMESALKEITSTISALKAQDVAAGISFEIEAGWNVGVVGRTGSGKSSIIVSLLRQGVTVTLLLTEPHQGTILIDDVNILQLGLKLLRSRIAVIPQDPLLFYGTVRSNLDPFNIYSDADIWYVLEQAAIKTKVAELPGQLSTVIGDEGLTFSVGQRQLICIARALLKKPKIMLADEATASVDTATDSLIQHALSRNSEGCTRITIAHRINTILSSTRVLVMDRGEVREYDTPENLINDEKSIFSQMVQRTQ